MPRSIFEQGVPIVRVPDAGLMNSPRNYNATIAEFGGHTWMAYRSHRMEQSGSCGIAITKLNGTSATGSQWIDLPYPTTRAEHHEDPRLFVFNGSLHLAYVESRFYPNRPYTCRIGYSRLNWTKARGWIAERTFFPHYGMNDGQHQEKNWMFFEAFPSRLHFIYCGEPHTIVELGADGVTPIKEHVAPAGTVCWPWGTVRGGTPPVKMEDGRWLTLFHSSRLLPVVKPPHWRRYYAAAYVFEPEAPFRIVAMSQRPLLTGSEADGHALDPRRTDSWKPFVVFPGGMVRGPGDSWRVAYGINDHFSAIAEHTDLALGDPGFWEWGSRYFLTENASLPVRVSTDLESGGASYVNWRRLKRPVDGLLPGGGILQVTRPDWVELISERPGVTEVTEERYKELDQAA